MGYKPPRPWPPPPPVARVVVEHDVHAGTLNAYRNGNAGQPVRVACVTEERVEAAESDAEVFSEVARRLGAAGIDSREAVEALYRMSGALRLRRRQERDRLVLDPARRPNVLTDVPRVRLRSRLRAFRRFSRVVVARCARDCLDVWRRERAWRRWARNNPEQLAPFG